jgi:RNA polymerase sigma-70 factor, ECF subfamily
VNQRHVNLIAATLVYTGEWNRPGRRRRRKKAATISNRWCSSTGRGFFVFCSHLTQDCFVRAYRARSQFRGASGIATWLMQIAANLLRSHESSGRLKFWRRSLDADADMAEIGGAIPDRQQSPEAAALVREQVQSIWRAAASLPGRQRTVFLLRFVEDMELREIAEVTGMKEGTVKAHLFRALQSVRARLEGKK